MDNKLIGNEKNILFYNDEEGNTKVEVLLENEDVWLNTETLAALLMGSLASSVGDVQDQ